jgi:multiple sugar transport system permease protein
MATTVAPREVEIRPAPVGRPRRRRRDGFAGTAVLLLGAFYCLLPVTWVLVAASKSGAELFDSFTFVPGGSLLANVAELSAYRSGLFWRWAANTALYAGLGGLLSAGLSGLTGYTLAMFDFRGRSAVFNVLMGGVLVPSAMLAVPQYLLLAKLGLSGSYLSVLLPSIVSPYGIYLARIYAAAAVPTTIVEAARADGAGEFRIFYRVALPMMLPGLVTCFLFQSVAIWNNYLLPYIMLGDDRKFPLTVGLVTLLKQGAQQPALYNLVITGSLLSILPLIALFLTLQRHWRADLVSGAVKG